MSRRRPPLKLVPVGDPQQFRDILFNVDHDSTTLGELLQKAPAQSTIPLGTADLDLPLTTWRSITPIKAVPNFQLYNPPEYEKNSSSREVNTPLALNITPIDKPPSAQQKPPVMDFTNAGMPQSVSEKDAVRLAYAQEIENAASFLRSELSVLIACDKLVVAHLWPEIAKRAQLSPVELSVPDEAEDQGNLVARSLRQRQLIQLKKLISTLKTGDVLVIPHLDLLAGGSDAHLSTETREASELVYKESDRLILAFTDRSQEIPEVLAGRFAVRLSITGVSRTVTYPNGDEKPLGFALVAADEAAHFSDFDPEGLYKNVAGMNPIRLRQAIRYAVREYAGSGVVSMSKLYEAIRAFKAQTSIKFEVPDVRFDQIGGYHHVKQELTRAIQLMAGSYRLPDERLRGELIPRGFIFYGPPGTGKTLFAKAIANQLNATIQVVSGPEVTDMYVGESERKVRELFTEARRNAPAVLVFDEFDSIASKRSGRDDGGSRAGNALVAQILTEMDGFRPDVPILVIGTTNRLDIIDDALLRPSRFKAIAIGPPNKEARQEIARVHAKHFGLEDCVSSQLLSLLADQTAGMSGDDIRSIFRDACVGKFCESPAKEVDARRLGELVGQLRRAGEERSSTTNRQRVSARQGLGRGERPRPMVAMINLSSDTRAAEETSVDVIEVLEELHPSGTEQLDDESISDTEE